MRFSDIRRLSENTGDENAVPTGEVVWCARAAGCIFMAQTTGRFLVSHRSANVAQPNTWGTWGGALDDTETPEEGMRREAKEECGYSGPMKITPLYRFKIPTFEFTNFLVIVPDEFEPRLDWETQDFRWCNFGEWPSPMHFGLESLLGDPASVRTMTNATRHTSQRTG